MREGNPQPQREQTSKCIPVQHDRGHEGASVLQRQRGLGLAGIGGGLDPANVSGQGKGWGKGIPGRGTAGTKAELQKHHEGKVLSWDWSVGFSRGEDQDELACDEATRKRLA